MNDLEKKSIECLKNMPIEETTYQVARNVVLDYITNLQQENEIVHKDFEELSQRYFFTKSKIEKAVEYLKDNACYTDENEFVSDLRYDNCEELLNILNGKE